MHANHVNVAYADSAEGADKVLAAKAAMMAELGIEVGHRTLNLNLRRPAHLVGRQT
jgi:hypothetical protein